MSSIYDAIQNKSLPKSEELERILVRILFKDFGSRVIEYISCARAIFNKDFPQRFLASATSKQRFLADRQPQKPSV